MLAAWNEGKFDAWAETWHPDVVIVAPKGWPDGEASHGIDAWRMQAERLKTTWAEARIEVEDIRSTENCVAVHIRYVTTGGGTQLPFDTQMAAAFFFEEGKVTLGHYFWNFDEALELAGFAE